MATIVRPVQPSAKLPVSTLGIAKRTLLKFLRTPQLVVLGTIQGAMFLLIFRYVFGGAIGAGGLNYVDFLVPGFITTGILFSGMGAAAGVAEDLEQGFVDRLRSLPIPRSSVLAGRALADTAMQVWGLAITTAIGFAVGFRIHGSPLDALAAFALLLVLGFAFEWLFITLGLFAGNAQAAQGMALMFFPLTILSMRFSSGTGTVLVTTISARGAFFSRSIAGPEKMPCVATAVTRSAPLATSTSAPFTIVPAVSMMSSIITQWRPATSPTTSWTSTWLATSRLRRLCRKASGWPSMPASFSALLTRPASGATTTSSPCSFSRMESASTGRAVRWSTGPSKNPWIWPECRSMVMIRSAPVTSSRSATSLAAIGSRERPFLSCRE